MTSPAWYPHLEAHERDRLLRFVERCLVAPRFAPRFGDEAMSAAGPTGPDRATTLAGEPPR